MKQFALYISMFFLCGAINLKITAMTSGVATIELSKEADAECKPQEQKQAAEEKDEIRKKVVRDSREITRRLGSDSHLRKPNKFKAGRKFELEKEGHEQSHTAPSTFQENAATNAIENNQFGILITMIKTFKNGVIENSIEAAERNRLLELIKILKDKIAALEETMLSVDAPVLPRNSVE